VRIAPDAADAEHVHTDSGNLEAVLAIEEAIGLGCGACRGSCLTLHPVQMSCHLRARLLQVMRHVPMARLREVLGLLDDDCDQKMGLRPPPLVDR
jgi:hypothetical protein